MSAYLKSAVWDLVLVAVVSAALSYIALTGFYVDPGLQYGPLPAVVAAVCCIALTLVARNRRTALIGGIVYGACLLVAWVVCGALTPGGQVFVDNESNYLIFSMVTTLVPTLCFLVTRKRVGAALLFVFGAFLCALIQLLYERSEVLWVVVFLLGALSLIIFKNYQQSLRTATTVRSASMLPGFCVALVAGVLVCGLGAGIWYGIIAPQDPQAVQIKLITEYRALETRQVVGTSNVFQTPNLDITSKQTNSSTRTTDDIKENVNGTGWPATGKEKEPDDQSAQNTFMGINVDSLQQALDFQQNPSVLPILLGIILLVAVLVAAYFVGRRLWRTRRLNKMRDLGAAGEFESLFLFLLSRFERLGLKVPKGQTVIDFGAATAVNMDAYDRAAGVSFADLTREYSSVAYGNREPSEESIGRIERFYGSFWKACRSQLGSIRYFFKSFRL